MTMAEMAMESLKEQIIRLENNREVPFNIGTNHGSTTRIGDHEIVDTYDEKYLLAHSLMCSESDGRPTLLRSHNYVDRKRRYTTAVTRATQR